MRSLTRAVRSSIERLRSAVDRMRQAVPAADLAWEVGVRFRRNNGAVLAGFLAYRMFIWFVPLALVLVAGVGFSTATNLDMVRFATEYGVSGGTASTRSSRPSGVAWLRSRSAWSRWPGRPSG